MLFRQIFDEKLAQYAYLIGCQRTGEALIVDPERDIDRYVAIAIQEGVTIKAVAETHIHADFLSGAREFAERFDNIQLYLSDEGDAEWKYEWAKDPKYQTNFLKHDDTFMIGNIELKVLHTPGHTPEHISFMITDRGGGAAEPMGILSGDFVFVGDLGRPDLLESAAGFEGAKEPSAERLFESTKAFLEMNDFLQVWPAHGAGSACGKALGAVPQSTVGYERRHNAAIQAAKASREQFVEFILAGQPEPPLYFARMKALNKQGAPVLGGVPAPKALEVDFLMRRSIDSEAVILDTRSAERFAHGHIPRSIHAPLSRSFPTVAGSMANEHQEIYLIVEADRVDEATRDLIRIGLDKVIGFVTPDQLERAEGLTATSVVDFAGMEKLRRRDDVAVLDVRRAAEFDEGHVPGAINIAHTRLAKRLEELPRDKKLLVHCFSGARASAATSLLEREGFDATLVEGMLSTWRPEVPALGAE